MFGKIAVRNVRRQIFNYLIYFITVTLTVSMMFSLCNLIFSEQVQSYARAMVKLQNSLIAVAVIVSLIVAVILGYATAFMLKLRKREFGTYLTLGMKRRDILVLFTQENLIIGAAALSCGVVLGLALYQIVIGMVARILEMKVQLGSYSASAFTLTIVLTLLMFFVSTLSSAHYLKKVSIYELLHAADKVDKEIRHPEIWLLITVCSVASVVTGIHKTWSGIQRMFTPNSVESAVMGQLTQAIAFLGLGIVLFHVGAAKSIIYYLLKNRRIKNRGINTFVLRELSGQLNSNSVLFGIIALLITATIVCTNISITQKNTTDQALENQYPFDLTATKTYSDDISSISYAEFDSKKAEQCIQKYVGVKKSVTYHVYTSKDGYLRSFTPWSGKMYEQLCDHFISCSDFNQILTVLGYPKVELDHHFLILADESDLRECDFSDAVLNGRRQSYSYLQSTEQYPHLADGYFTAVVPDELLEEKMVESEITAYVFSTDNYKVQALYDDLERTIKDGLSYRSPFQIRAYHKLGETSLSAILMVGELYMAIVFVFMAVAILTMKLLSEIPEDRRRYELLYKLGLSQRKQKKALFCQTFSFFLFPFLVPLLLSIPIARICGQTLKLVGFAAMIPQVYVCAGMIAIILVLIQWIYFIATFYVQKQRVIV